MKDSKKFRVPSCSGGKGIPPKQGACKGLPKGIASPTLSGSRGKPHGKSFPGGPAARD